MGEGEDGYRGKISGGQHRHQQRSRHGCGGLIIIHIYYLLSHCRIHSRKALVNVKILALFDPRTLKISHFTLQRILANCKELPFTHVELSTRCSSSSCVASVCSTLPV